MALTLDIWLPKARCSGRKQPHQQTRHLEWQMGQFHNVNFSCYCHVFFFGAPCWSTLISWLLWRDKQVKVSASNGMWMCDLGVLLTCPCLVSRLTEMIFRFLLILACCQVLSFIFAVLFASMFYSSAGIRWVASSPVWQCSKENCFSIHPSCPLRTHWKSIHELFTGFSGQNFATCMVAIRFHGESIHLPSQWREAVDAWYKKRIPAEIVAVAVWHPEIDPPWKPQGSGRLLHLLSLSRSNLDIRLWV